MAISFRCCDCNVKLKAPDDSSGRRVKCSHCGKIVEVPDDGLENFLGSLSQEDMSEEEGSFPIRPIRSSYKPRRQTKRQTVIPVWVVVFTLLILLIPLGIWGWKQLPKDLVGSRVELPEEPLPLAKKKVRQEIFEPLYRTVLKLRVGQEIGMNREKYGELLSEFTLELMLTKEKASSSQERKICVGYSDLLTINKHAAYVWDRKISVPRLRLRAEKYYDYKGKLQQDLDMFKRMIDFTEAAVNGIPLKDFPNIPSGGLGVIIERYRIPVTEFKGWEIIPNDSVQRIWVEAVKKNAEVDKLRTSNLLKRLNSFDGVRGLDEEPPKEVAPLLLLHEANYV